MRAMAMIDKLRRIKATGLTQQEVADKLGVSFPTLNSWINGKSEPRSRNKQKIDELYSDIFGTSAIDAQVLADKKERVLALADKNILVNILKSQEMLDKLTLKITYNTNTIEGNTLTEADTENVLFRKKTLPDHSLVEHLEASNHRKAFLLSLELAKEDGLAVENILSIHSVLMGGILENAGKFRNHAVRILGSNVPTANFLKLNTLMKEFVKTFNAEPTDVIKQIAKTHAKFEQIHPFSDGNGRVGRLLMSILALKKHLPPVLVLQERRRAYYKYLRLAQLEERYDLLEDFVCDAILEAHKIQEQQQQ